MTTTTELVTFDQLAPGDHVDMEDGFGIGTVESVEHYSAIGMAHAPVPCVRVRVGGLAYEGMYGYAQTIRVTY